MREMSGLAGFASALSFHFIGNGKFLAAFGAAASKNGTTLFCGHAFAETMRLSAFALLGLVCSLGHRDFGEDNKKVLIV